MTHDPLLHKLEELERQIEALEAVARGPAPRAELDETRDANDDGDDTTSEEE